MILKFDGTYFSEWMKISQFCWQRPYLYYPSKTIVSPISIKLVDVRDSRGWYPDFFGEFEFLQSIYDKLDLNIFPQSQEKMAMNDIDNFLIKIDKIKAFI